MNVLQKIVRKIKKIYAHISNHMSKNDPKDITILKEIAVNILLLWTPIKLAKWIPVILSIHSTVGGIVSDQIDLKIQQTVNDFIKQIHETIKNQYRYIHSSLLFEGVLWLVLILVKKNTDLLSDEKIIMIFWSMIILRFTIGSVNSLRRIGTCLKKSAFFKHTKFIYYYQQYHNIKQSIKADAYNFYQIYYKILLSKYLRVTHKVTSMLKMMPSKDDIFNRLWNVLVYNIHDFFWKKMTIFIVMCLFYIIIILLLRYYVQIYFL